MNTRRIRVVLFEDEGFWCAQCLEFDVGAQAGTVPALLDELQRILSAHIEIAREVGRKPFAGLPPAPQRFFDAYESSRTPLQASDGRALPRLDQAPFIVPELRFAEPTVAR
jgi:hypothetical protein